LRRSEAAPGKDKDLKDYKDNKDRKLQTADFLSLLSLVSLLSSDSFPEPGRFFYDPDTHRR
jgi:hypothetical protein